MTDFDSLRADLARAERFQAEYAQAVGRYADENTRQHKNIWEDMGELRDELHALANRVENLTRALMAEPGDVADAIVRHAAGRVFDQEAGQ